MNKYPDNCLSACLPLCLSLSLSLSLQNPTRDTRPCRILQTLTEAALCLLDCRKTSWACSMAAIVTASSEQPNSSSKKKKKKEQKKIGNPLSAPQIRKTSKHSCLDFKHTSVNQSSPSTFFIFQKTFLQTKAE